MSKRIKKSEMIEKIEMIASTNEYPRPVLFQLKEHDAIMLGFMYYEPKNKCNIFRVERVIIMENGHFSKINTPYGENSVRCYSIIGE